MARVSIICGTADRSGTTHSMCFHASRFLKGKGFDVDMLLPSEMDIGHCRDCDSCSSGECIIQDDMARIYSSVSSADLLILATPIHFSGPSSILKTVMDRFQPYWSNKSLPHPEYCLLMMCGGSENPDFSITEKIVRAFCITMGMELLGNLGIPHTDKAVEDLQEKVESFLRITEDMEI